MDLQTVEMLEALKRTSRARQATLDRIIDLAKRVADPNSGLTVPAVDSELSCIGELISQVTGPTSKG